MRDIVIAADRQKLRLLAGTLALAAFLLVGCKTQPGTNDPQAEATPNVLDPNFVPPNELAAVGLPRGCVLRWRSVRWQESDSDQEGRLEGELVAPSDASILAVEARWVEITQARTPSGELLQSPQSRYGGAFQNMSHVFEPPSARVYAKLPHGAEQFDSLEDVRGRIRMRIATERKVVEIDSTSRKWITLSPGLKVRLSHVAGIDHAPAASDSANSFSVDYELVFQADPPVAPEAIMSVEAIDAEGRVGRPFMSGGSLPDGKYFAEYSFRVDPPFSKFRLVIAEQWIERELPFHIDHLPLRLNATP